jgi:CRP-like cAMP-binding protein
MATPAKRDQHAASGALLPLFAGLEPGAVEHIWSAGRVRHVDEGAYFFHQGEPAERFYILISGRVRLTQITAEGQQVIMAVLGPSDGLGIIVALSDMAYPVTAEAVEPTDAIGWSAVDIRTLMLEHPQLGLNGMKLIARRFADVQDRFRELATERVERRVARALLRLVRQAGRKVDEGVLIDMSLSRQDLAEMTGTTLYTVSRILSDWESRGLVSAGRERVTLRRTHELVVIAEDLPEPLRKP